MPATCGRSISSASHSAPSVGTTVPRSCLSPSGSAGELAEPGQVDGYHLAFGGQDVHDRVPGLPVVADAVQQEQRFAGAHARVGQGHGPRTVRGREG